MSLIAFVCGFSLRKFLNASESSSFGLLVKSAAVEYSDGVFIIAYDEYGGTENSTNNERNNAKLNLDKSARRTLPRVLVMNEKILRVEPSFAEPRAISVFCRRKYLRL